MNKIVLGTLLTVALTIAVGILQGSLSNRWGASDSQRQSGLKLESFPKKFADWQMEKAEELDQNSLDQLQPYGYLQRVYKNRKNDALVSVTVLLGPNGRISVHTPEVCFAGRNHEQIGERVKIRIPDKEGKDSIWKTSFRLQGVDAKQKNIYYGWSSGSHWDAADNPRISYATKPLLYKIQLSNDVSVESSKQAIPSADPAIQFLTDFFPVLQDYLEKPESK
jgi:hypothetical protein